MLADMTGRICNDIGAARAFGQIQSGWQSVQGVAGGIEQLGKAFDRQASGWERFASVVDGVLGILSSAPARPDSSNSDSSRPNSSNLANIGKDSIAAPTADHFIDTEKMVMLPITQKVYRDTSYTAWVSGYAAALDSIHIHRPTLPPLELRPARRHRPHAQRRATLRRGRFFNQIIRMNPLKTRQITCLLQKIVVHFVVC